MVCDGNGGSREALCERDESSGAPGRITDPDVRDGCPTLGKCLGGGVLGCNPIIVGAGATGGGMQHGAGPMGGAIQKGDGLIAGSMTYGSVGSMVPR